MTPESTLRDDETRLALAPAGWLTLEGEPAERGLRLLPTRGYTLGRSRDNDLVVDSDFASTRHARLYTDGDGWSLEDLTSTNGVMVNRRRIRAPRRLSDGDVIDVGGQVYRLHLAPLADTGPTLTRGARSSAEPSDETRRGTRSIAAAGAAVLGLIGLAVAAIGLWPDSGHEPPTPRAVAASPPPAATPEPTRGSPAADTPPPPAEEASAAAVATAASRAPGAATPPDRTPEISIPANADFTRIFTNAAPDLRVFRMAAAERVLVFDYPSLAELGRALNRVALLVEERDMPRDRVLGMDELAAYLEREGLYPATFYYGHNYRGTHLAHFFNLAEQDGVVLNPGEHDLLELLLETRVLHRRDAGYVANAPTAILGVSQLQDDDPDTPDEELIDPSLRYAILRHELSHGVFFTDPAYRDHVMDFWANVFTEDERTAFRTFLADAHYNPDDEVMMANEAHAYLLHTPDQRAFDIASVGLSPERAAQLHERFHANAPPTPLLADHPPLAALTATLAERQP